MISRKIKVWDLEAALDPRVPASSLCLRSLKVIVACLFEVKNILKKE